MRGSAFWILPGVWEVTALYRNVYRLGPFGRLDTAQVFKALLKPQVVAFRCRLLNLDPREDPKVDALTGVPVPFSS